MNKKKNPFSERTLFHSRSESSDKQIMNTIQKRRIRKIVLCSAVGILILGVVLKLTIEPADYYKSLYSQAEKAEKMVDKAIFGNDNGQYSEYTVSSFSEQVEKAKQTATEKTLKYSKIKAYYQDFREELKVFQKAANNNCLSEQEVASLREEGKSFEKTVQLSDGRSLQWCFNGKAVKNPAPINLEVKPDSLYQQEFEYLAQGFGTTGSTIAFLHNGALPCTATVTLSYQTDLKDLQVYRYDGQTRKIGHLIRAEVSDNHISFPISEGGVYFILEISAENAQNADKNPDEVVIDAVTQANQQKENEKTQSSSDMTAQTKSEADRSFALTASASASAPFVSSEKTAAKKYCMVEIRCDTVVDTGKLTNQAVAKYIPKDGVILAETKMEIAEGETAFEVLKRVTREEGIQMEFRSDPLYSGAYIEGINHLYELDGGSGSGWMYKVNGWFPNYGCSQYKLKDGDKMVWCYTCNIGKDVGDQYYDTHPDANPEYS